MEHLDIKGDICSTYLITCEPGDGVYESNFVNGDRPLLWKKAPPEPGSKNCNLCKASKAQSAYSGAQLKRGGQRMCAECVLARQWKTPLPEPSGPSEPHVLMFLNCAAESDSLPFMPQWNKDEMPEEFTWLAADAPASHTPPDAATLAARRAIVPSPVVNTSQATSSWFAPIVRT